MIVSTQSDRVNIWSKKKSEVVATLNVPATTAAKIQLKSSSDWGTMMKVTEKVGLADIQSITVGTANGVTVWYPTQKQHLETFTSGHDIKGKQLEMMIFISSKKAFIFQLLKKA